MHQSKGKKLETRITGQMMVSSTISKSLGMLTEFVVFGVDSSEGGHEALDFLPNNQLAVIVMSLPKDGSSEEILIWKVSYSSQWCLCLAQSKWGPFFSD